MPDDNPIRFQVTLRNDHPAYSIFSKLEGRERSAKAQDLLELAIVSRVKWTVAISNTEELPIDRPGKPTNRPAAGPKTEPDRLLALGNSLGIKR